MSMPASRMIFSRSLVRTDLRSPPHCLPTGSLRLFTASSTGKPLVQKGASTPPDATSSHTEGYDNVLGTVAYHTSYTLLRHPKPPSTYPSRLDAGFSKIGRELMVQAARRKAIVNFWWDGTFESESDARGERYPFLTFYFPDSKDRLPVRVRSGYVTSDRHAEEFFDSSPVSSWSGTPDKEVYLLVCTHGSRDCRCSDRGGPLVEALKSELFVRVKRDGEGSVWSRIRVGEAAHVGGHKYAPNLLVFPFGDWLAQLTPEHVPQILDTISSRLSILDNIKALDAQGSGKRLDRLEKELFAPLIVSTAHWRGRSGLTKEEQLQLYNSYQSAT